MHHVSDCWTSNFLLQVGLCVNMIGQETLLLCWKMYTTVGNNVVWFSLRFEGWNAQAEIVSAEIVQVRYWLLSKHYMAPCATPKKFKVGEDGLTRNQHYYRQYFMPKLLCEQCYGLPLTIMIIGIQNLKKKSRAWTQTVWGAVSWSIAHQT